MYQEDYFSLLNATETGVRISYEYEVLEDSLGLFVEYTKAAISEVTHTHTTFMAVH